MDSHFSPGGLMTWTTDFGLENAFVGTMKGVFCARASGVEHVDLTHGIPPQAVDVAALELRHALPYFPEGTVHLVVVDPGVGTSRRILFALSAGQCVIGPDNGLLPHIFRAGSKQGQNAGTGAAVRYFVAETEGTALEKMSSTFHGRDVFAPLAAAVCTGRVDPNTAQPCSDPLRLPPSAPIELDEGRGWRLQVLMADRFGNLITNWDREEQSESLNSGRVQAGECEFAIQKTYADAEPGEPLALLNSWGHLEIAIRDGNAAQSLGLQRGDWVLLFLGQQA